MYVGVASVVTRIAFLKGFFIAEMNAPANKMNTLIATPATNLKRNFNLILRKEYPISKIANPIAAVKQRLSFNV